MSEELYYINYVLPISYTVPMTPPQKKNNKTVNLLRFVWDHGGEDIHLCIFNTNQNITLPMHRNTEGIKHN